MAKKFVLKLSDEKGNAFRIKIKSPWRPVDAGSWRTLDKGYICYNSGPTIPILKGGLILPWGPGEGDRLGWSRVDLLLFNADETWGVRLNKVWDFIVMNDEGKGKILQPWALKIDPGRIAWDRVE